MGNPNLVVTINEYSYFVKGTEYLIRNDAVLNMIARFEKDIKELKKVADKPEECFGMEEIRKIIVNELFN